ncbi:MAG: Uma2 family endonuclease [Planctomycetes bacterium]|nr:Uma2 family endonuclease [Planctomycetota bacterium]
MPTMPSAPQLTYADYLEFPDDGQRHELVAGVHVVSAAPQLAHQIVVVGLVDGLRGPVRAVGGLVLCAPTALRLSDEDGVEPDVLVVLPGDGSRTSPREVIGAPSLVVEVLSRSTRRLDLGMKLASYERHGVGEYWVVDVELRELQRFAREGERFAAPIRHRERVAWDAVPGLTIDLAALWADVERLGAGAGGGDRVGSS